MKKPLGVHPSALPPKTLVLRDVATYLGLGSPQSAERWLKAHQVLIFQDRLGYNRAFVRDIDAANLKSAAEAYDAPRVKAAAMG
jgi:hypothetical protein